MLSETNLDLHRSILDQAEAMRPLPQAVIDLARTVSSPESGLRDVADCLRTDPVLTAVVLREANSAFAGAREAASTVEQAVVRLGGARVLAIAVAHSLPSEVNQALPGYGIHDGGLQTHAVATSHVADVIRGISPTWLPPSVVTAGLLHDIGKILLGRLLRPQLIPAARSNGEPITAAERELLDLDHGEVGAALAVHWKLPDEIVRAIQFHHEPWRADDLAFAVALADRIAHHILHDQETMDETGPPRGDGGQIEQVAAETLKLDLSLVREKATERLDRAGLLPVIFGHD
jgi:putative nucleotidyltransferase with HDIG domain